MQFHGWNDWQISPRSSVRYYENVLKTVGPSSQASYRLFMAPGMGHCGGGEGPNSFDMLGAMEEWVEKGKALDSMLANRVVDHQVVRTRPLCPYPQVARYSGQGSIDDAANFRCMAP